MRRSRSRWGSVIWLTSTILIALSDRSGAQQLNALATSSFNSTRANQAGNAVHLDTFDQVLDVNWNTAISPVLSYRLGLRAAESDTRSLSGATMTTTQNTMLEPTLDVSLRGPTYTLSTGARMRNQFIDGNRTERDEPGDWTVFTRLVWTPVGLPDVNLQYEHRREDDFRAPFARDLDEDRVRLATKYTVYKVNLDYMSNLVLSNDRVTGVERTQWQHQGSLGYADAFFADRLAVNLFYQPSYTTNSDRFAVSSTGTLPRLIGSGFSGLEPNPAITDPVNAPLNPAPQLIDGDATTGVPLLINQPIGAALGNTSIGFEVLTGESVDTIRVVANPGFNPTQASALIFRVFASANRLNWTEIAGAAQTFNILQNRFELGFVATAARFFKVFVAANTSLVPVQAVELEALGPGTGTAGRTLTNSTLSQSLSGGITLRPVSFSTLSYYLSMGDVRQEPQDQRTTNMSQTVSLGLNPHPRISSSISLTRAVNDSNQPALSDTTNDSLSASVSYAVLPTLSSTLAFSHADGYRGDAKETTTNGGSLSFTGQLYRNLTGDLNLSVSRSQDRVAANETTSYGSTLNITGRLTERLQATLGYTTSLSESTSQSDLQSSQSGSLNLTYVVSRLFTLGAKYDAANAGNSTTFTQQYRFDWNPSGQLSLFGFYTRTDQFQSNAALATQNGGLTARWNLSRSFDLNLGYQYSRGISGDEQHTVSGNLSFRL